jgi:DNA repair protein RecO (recombination protein O)
MRVLSQAAFVLHARPYRETSLILEIFSHEHGRLGAIAKGARNPKSRQRALLLPFTPLLLSWSGKGELALLTGVEAVGPARELSGQNRYAAYYLNELILRLLHRHDAHPELFDCYAATLAKLHDDDSIQDGLRIFEKRLLAGIGYAMILDHDTVSGQPLEPERLYQYLPERGPELSTNDRMTGHCLLGRSMLELDREHFSNARSRHEARRLTRFLIDKQTVERSLRSRQVFHQVISAVDLPTT